MREAGYDVRLQRLRLTAYDGLPATAEFSADQSTHDSEEAGGERVQTVIDVSCLLQREEDGDYSVEYSFQREERPATPWELGLLERPSSDGGPFPEVISATSQHVVTLDEWCRTGGISGSGVDQPADLPPVAHEDCTMILVRITEPPAGGEDAEP
jgi:hypothetical protein